MAKIDDIVQTLPFRADNSEILGVPKKKRKYFVEIQQALKQRGFSAIKNVEIIDFIRTIFDMRESEVLEVSQNENIPFVIRIIAKAFCEKETSTKTVFDLLRMLLIDNERVNVAKVQVGMFKSNKTDPHADALELAKKLYGQRDLIQD